jgi:beta-glucosidase/6-phospho-beta-glucosidase/beta-galactosidase
MSEAMVARLRGGRTPRRWTSALAGSAALLSIGLAIVMPSGAGAVEERPVVGVQFHATWSDYTDAQRIEVLDRLAAAGVRWVRIDVGWASFQEQGPTSYSQWYVNLVDRMVDAARARGMQVLCTLWMTPGWANGGRGTMVPPTDDASYAHMATWAAAHFRGRVAAWEVWNEPNLDYFFAGSAERYARLLRAAYPAFKAGDANALVVLGGPVNNDTAWLESVYKAGAKGSFDVMATHPYQGPSDLAPETPDNGTMWTLSHVSAVHALMARYGDGEKPIWFTEFGWSSHENWRGVENWNRGVTQQQQADYLVRTIKYVAANHPYVTNIFWYNERNNAGDNPQYNNYGLLNRDLSPKPAYAALKEYLTGASPTSGSGATKTKPRKRGPQSLVGTRLARLGQRALHAEETL